MPAPPNAPGWFSDPSGRHQWRWWDGVAWTDQVSDNGVQATDAVAGGPPLAPVPPPAPLGAGGPSYGPSPPTGPLRPAPRPIVPGTPGVAGAPRSKVPLLIGLGVVAVALLVIAALAFAGGGGSTGEGEVAGEIDSAGGGIVTRRVSLPAGSVLVVQATPDSRLDIAVSVLGDGEDADDLEDLIADLADVGLDSVDLDAGAADGLGRFLTSVGGDTDDLSGDGVDDDALDGLPPARLMTEDPGFAGDEEVLVLATAEPLDDLVVAFTGFAGDEGEFEATITIVRLDVDDDSPEAFLEACSDSDELGDLLG